MNWNNIKITIFKELRGIVRDKKSLQKLIIFPLLIPFIILLFGGLFDSLGNSKYSVGVNYQLTKDEVTIVNSIENLDIAQYKTKKELESAYNNNDISGYIVKDKDTYTIYADESKASGEMVLSLASSYLEAYNSTLGNQELIDNGLDPNEVLNNLKIETVSLTKDDSNIMTTMIFSLVITYLIMIVVLVCVVVVTDATSGEKERGTLETILTFPVKSGELILGKYLASSILGFIVGLVSYLLSIPTIFIGKSLFKSYDELVFTTDAFSITLIIFVIFLSALLSAGVCMALAGKAKTYKEAQSSLQFVTLLPMIPYFLKMMDINNTIFNLIPIANCASLLNDIVMNSINYQALMTVIISTIVYIVCILLYISKQYKKEETLFS